MKKMLLVVLASMGAGFLFAQTKEQMAGTFEMSVPDKAMTTITLSPDGTFNSIEQAFSNGKWVTKKTTKGRWAIEGDKLNTTPAEVTANGSRTVCTEKLNQQPGNCFKEDFLFATDRIWTVNAAGAPAAIYVRTN